MEEKINEILSYLNNNCDPGDMHDPLETVLDILGITYDEENEQFVKSE